MEGLRNHNFIIPRPRQIIKGNMDENDGNAKELLTEQPPTSCPEPAGMSLRDDMVLFLSCIAEGWKDSSNGGIIWSF